MTPETNASPAWDIVTDIVCVGSGAAALSAAINANGNGDAVVVVEKMAVVGGTTVKSGGNLWVPNNYALRAKGVTDSRADCLRYMARFSYPEDYVEDGPTLGLTPDAYALLEAFYDNASPALDRLRTLGALRSGEWTIHARGSGKYGATVASPFSPSCPDYFDHAPENKVPSGRSIGPLRDDGLLGNGTDLIAQFHKFLVAAGVPILMEHPVRRLVRNTSGDVIGVVADHKGKAVRIRARKAVIFGTGGYVQNPDFVGRFQHNRIYGSCAAMGAQGDFIRIANEAGGALMGNLTGAWRTQVVVEHALEKRVLDECLYIPAGDSMFMVNKYGQRVVDEYRSYNDRAKIHASFDPTREEYPNQILFMLFDQRTMDVYGGFYPLPAPGTTSPYIIAGATWAEVRANVAARLAGLRDRIGGVALAADFDARLTETIQRFNRFAATGKDDDFGRGAQEFDRAWFGLFSPRRADADNTKYPLPRNTMYPIAATGPYYAIIVGAGALDTNGGPVINANAQVMSYGHTPIPGLYGAGNCIASPSREAYYGGGCTLGLALAFGYIAARNSHDEPVKPD